MKPDPKHDILDVGGTENFWSESSYKGQVTMLNTETSRFGAGDEGRRKVVGDGCALPFADQSFDIVFSNSVIEHVGTWERQLAFANESRRVGKAVWIQTPAREFFIEPHLLAPFIHWFPRGLQRRLIGRFTPRGWMEWMDARAVEGFLDEVRLLTFGEMQRLFPDCLILKERLFGLVKSYTAMRRHSIPATLTESTGKSGM
jgi:SAM-dependent methyltransferase